VLDDYEASQFCRKTISVHYQKKFEKTPITQRNICKNLLAKWGCDEIANRSHSFIARSAYIHVVGSPHYISELDAGGGNRLPGRIRIAQWHEVALSGQGGLHLSNLLAQRQCFGIIDDVAAEGALKDIQGFTLIVTKRGILQVFFHFFQHFSVAEKLVQFHLGFC
jgi:hypothetical protein